MDEGPRRAFLVDAALTLVTLGFYMPYWFYRRNRDVRRAMPRMKLANNAVWLSSGAALAALARFWLGEEADDLAASLSLVGISVFLVGTHLLARNTARACDTLGLDMPIPPAVFTTVLGVVFFGLELGNEFQELWVRIPVVALLVALPYAFWRLHLGIFAVRVAPPEARKRERRGAPTS